MARKKISEATVFTGTLANSDRIPMATGTTGFALEISKLKSDIQASETDVGFIELATTVEATTGTDTTRAVTPAGLQAALDALVDSAPGALDTLNELAAALGDDANFSTTVTNSLATKLNLSGGTMTGDLTMGANNIITSGNVDGRDVGTDGTNQDAIQTALGISAAATDFGVFTGYTLGDNLDAQALFQAIETELEGNPPAPVTLGGNQNNHPLADDSHFLVVNNTGNVNFRGIVAPTVNANGYRLVIINIGTNRVRLQNENANATDVNRFTGGGNHDIQQGEFAIIFYNTDLNRWVRQMGTA